jgi:biopolymer transport protein ExbD
VKFPRRTLEDPAINLTPLIDVVFLLLIFFMVTTTFTRDTRLSVNLPEADAQQAEAMPDQIEVLVSQAGRYSVNDRILTDTQAASLSQALMDVASGNRNLPILLIADADATHQAVVTAMDAIGQAGFNRLSIATRRPQDGQNQDGQNQDGQNQDGQNQDEQNQNGQNPQ